jgi:hypothetical protein
VIWPRMAARGPGATFVCVLFGRADENLHPKTRAKLSMSNIDALAASMRMSLAPYVDFAAACLVESRTPKTRAREEVHVLFATSRAAGRMSEREVARHSWVRPWDGHRRAS